MISISFTGGDLRDVANQAVEFGVRVFGTSAAPLGPTPGDASAALAQEWADANTKQHEPEAAAPGVVGQGEPSTPSNVASLETAKRTRRTKAEMEAARAAEASAAKGGPIADASAALFDAPGDDPAPEVVAAPKPTFEDLKEALKRVCEFEGAGVDAARKLLTEFSIKKLSELAEPKFAEFVAAADKLSRKAK